MDLLHVFTITWNNSKNLQQFIEWYRKRVPNCQITVFDNMSTDNTKEICEQYGVEHVLFDTNNQMDEQTLIELRNLCYFESDTIFLLFLMMMNLWILQNKIFLIILKIKNGQYVNVQVMKCLVQMRNVWKIWKVYQSIGYCKTCAI